MRTSGMLSPIEWRPTGHAMGATGESPSPDIFLFPKLGMSTRVNGRLTMQAQDEVHREGNSAL